MTDLDGMNLDEINNAFNLKVMAETEIRVNAWLSQAMGVDWTKTFEETLRLVSSMEESLKQARSEINRLREFEHRYNDLCR